MGICVPSGDHTRYAFGDSLTPDLANYRGKNEGTTPVGRFQANAFGLYDMHGNVWEWCQDTSHKNYNGAPTDGSAWLSSGQSKERVRRGGSWNADPGRCRSAFRFSASPDVTYDNQGFRVCCSAPRTPQAFTLSPFFSR